MSCRAALSDSAFWRLLTGFVLSSLLHQPRVLSYDEISCSLRVDV